MSQKIAVLITCHNRKEKTLSCLSALYKCLLPEGCSFSVYLVDDGCTDGTNESIRHQFPMVNIIQGNGNLYWNRGMHLAWKEAAKYDYDYYLWLNDDTFLHNDSIKILLEGAHANNNEVIICGLTQSSLDKRITYGGYLLNNNTQILQPNGKFQQCDFFNGNIVLIPKNIFKKVGFLDPFFHHSLGDFDYGLRAEKLGIKSHITPLAIGICEKNSEKPNWKDYQLPLKKRLHYFNQPSGPDAWRCFIFERRHLGLTTAIFHYFTIHLSLLFHK
jgi:Predicted glycosyltransferases